MRTVPTINGRPCPEWLIDEFIDHLVDTATVPVQQLDLPAEFAQFLANKYGHAVTGEHIDGSDRTFALPDAPDA